MSATYYSYVQSPVGPLLLSGDGSCLSGLSFSVGRKARAAEFDWIRNDELFTDASAQLAQYFSGDLTEFRLALAPKATAFQKSVLDALLDIPHGQTRSYLDIARSIGNPKAVRAVGGANGNNPIAIIIPCHRVVGSNGKLTGFGGGLENKRFLLDLERGDLLSI